MLIRCIFGVLLAAQCVLMIPVDNDVVGEPEVECAGEAIGITFRTKNPFNGRLYVKGRYDDGECRNALIGRTFTAISLQFETCGMTRLRSLNPRGIFTSIAVVISFHPQFVTKVDRVYNIQCFYMEADKTVNQQLQVAELNTAFITATVPMPVCSYEILNGGPNGEPVSYAIVGQQVYHKWTCDTETQNTFCMIVQSCFIDDGRGNKVEMINEEGCAIDKHIITNLEYPEDLVAGQEAHVFKYADRSALFFQCQISISLKEPGATCPLPLCAQPLRQKRFAISSLRDRLTLAEHTVDVRSREIEMLDVFDILPQSETPLGVRNQTTSHYLSRNMRASICVSNASTLQLIVSSFMISFCVIICLVIVRLRKFSVESSSLS